MSLPSLKNDPRGYGAVHAAEIISTVPDTRLGWTLCNRRLHVMRALKAGPNVTLAAELALIDAKLVELATEADRRMNACLAGMMAQARAMREKRIAERSAAA